MKAILNFFWILTGIILFFISLGLYYKYYNMLNYTESMKKEQASFVGLYNTIEDVCRGFIGEKRVLTIYLMKNSSIYGDGNLLCYESNDKLCKSTTCQMEKFNISTNDFLDEYFNEGIVKIKVTIVKNKADTIKIEYKPIV